MLLGLCSRLGLDPSGRVFEVGRLPAEARGPTARPLPGAVRLRALATNLFLPADAELVPALLDDEAEGLARDRGLVFLPGGRILGFDPRARSTPSALLTAAERPRPAPGSRCPSRAAAGRPDRRDRSWTGRTSRPEAILDAGGGVDRDRGAPAAPTRARRPGWPATPRSGPVRG